MKNCRHIEFLNFQMLASSISAYSSSCQECKFAVDLLHDAWGKKTTEECVGEKLY